MKFPRAFLLFGLLAGLLAPHLLAGQEPSLAELARESQRKKEQSSRKIWTNDDFPAVSTQNPLAGPTVKRLGKLDEPSSLSPYEPTPLDAVEVMLRMTDVRRDEVVFDLGSGDGRILIMAVEWFGARGVGIELNEELVAASRKVLAERELEKDVTIIHADILDVDLSPADVVTLYLVPGGIELLRPHMERYLRRGTRVVSYRYEIRGWTPVQVKEMNERRIYLYVVP